MTQVFLVAQHFVQTTEFDYLFEITEDICILLQIIPVEPGDLVVLTIGVIVALLRVAHLVAREYHRDTLTHHQQCDGVLHLAVAQGIDVSVVCRTFIATVPTIIMVLTITVIFAIGFVVLLVVRHEVHQCETVVCRNEVHAGLDASFL